MRFKHVAASVLCLLILGLCLLTGCSKSGGAVSVKDVMIPNSEGTYTRAQIVLPSDYEGHRVPVVSLAHGFHGTMNSAGAENLSHALAENGIAAVRMDFSHYVSDDPASRQTGAYTTASMAEDMALCADYVTKHCNGDPQRIGAFGRSLGGRAAMLLVNENVGGLDCKGLVLVAPAGNGDAFQRYMGGRTKWKQFKKKAAEQGSIVHQGVVLTPDFFKEIEDYVPSEHGDRFQGPVLVFYNTEDRVVLPKAAIECAESYPNHRLVEVTSAKSPHGLEMGLEESEIKDRIFSEIVTFYQEALR